MSSKEFGMTAIQKMFDLGLNEDDMDKIIFQALLQTLDNADMKKDEKALNELKKYKSFKELGGDMA